METKKKLSVGYFQAAGFLSLMPALSFWALWVLLGPSSDNKTSADRITEYLNYFPEIMKDTLLLFIIAAVTIFLAIILSILNFRSVSKAFRVLAVITIILGAYLFFVELLIML